METLNTYKTNAQFKIITFEMIDKIAALNIPQNEKFNFCKPSLAQAIVNPLKVSYIKKDKIKSLKEHAKISLPLSPTPEQQNKNKNINITIVLIAALSCLIILFILVSINLYV